MAKGIYIGVSENSLVVNGDFSNGLDGWVAFDKSNSVISLSTDAPETRAGSNSLSLTYSGATSYSALAQTVSTVSIITNHKYYVSCWLKVAIKDKIGAIDIRPSNGNEIAIGNSSSENVEGEWVFKSDVQTATTTSSGASGLSYLKSTTVTGNGNVLFNDYRCYDLTTMYGSGNEPTKEWCDSNLKALENLYKLQNGIARKVKKAYIGVNGVARKVKKGYIGVGGVARQFYSAETLVPFTSNPAPTSWTGSGLSATSSNDYGEWSVVASSGATVYHSFDSDTSTYWKSGSYTTAQYVEIYCPNGVSIKPENISVMYSRFKSGSIYGLDISTGTWKRIFDMSYSSSTVKTETFMYEGESYFSAFRVSGYLYSDSYSDRRVYDFKITSGTLKIE